MPPRVITPPMTSVSDSVSPNSHIPQTTVRIGEALLNVATWLASNRRRARFWYAHPNGVTKSPRNARASHADVETWSSGGKPGAARSAIGQCEQAADQERTGQDRHCAVPHDQRLADCDVASPRHDGPDQQQVGESTTDRGLGAGPAALLPRSCRADHDDPGDAGQHAPEPAQIRPLQAHPQASSKTTSGQVA